jgi:hypothetical protein
MAIYNNTKKLAKSKKYNIKGKTHTYRSLCNKVIAFLKVKPRSPTVILKHLGVTANSQVHLLPTMLSDGLIEVYRIPKTDKLVYSYIKRNLLQELMYPHDKILKRFTIISRKTMRCK